MQFGYRCCRSWEWEQAHKTRGSASNPRLDGGAALGLGCCAATAQRGHHCCRSQCCKRSLQDMIVCAFSAGDVLFLKVGRRLLRLGCCAAYPSLLKVSCWLARKTHATFSPSLRCVLFVIEAVCSMACSVLTCFTMFWGFFPCRIPGAVCFSLFHCKAMTLLADTLGGSTFTVGVCSFSFIEVHFACRCAAQVFF